MIAKTFALPVAALFAALATPAVAVTIDDTVSIAVPFTYARIVTETGRAELRQRVLRAVKQVCPTEYRADLAMANANTRCRAKALASAERQMIEQFARAAAPSQVATIKTRSAH